MVGIPNLRDGHHGDAFFNDHIRLPWQVSAFGLTAPSDCWDFFAIGIESGNNSTACGDLHLDAFNVFVASPEREVKNSNFRPASTEQFVTSVNGWVFTHQTSTVKKRVAGAIWIIPGDAPCKPVTTGGGGPQAVAFTVVGGGEVHRIGHNRTVDWITKVSVAAINMAPNNRDWSARCTPQQHCGLSVDTPVPPVFARLKPSVIGDV